MSIRAVAVTLHPSRPEALRAALSFCAGMAEAGITVLADRAGRQSLQLAGVPPENLASLSSQTPPELAVVFGGDGNILRAAEWAVPRQVPVLGVNLGHVGFLAELESADIIELIERVIEKDYKVERRQTVDATVFDAEGAQVWHSFAVNECSIEKNARERMIEVLVRIDSRPLSRWATDGVLVATPTGSTAYAFSAHGPVVWPGVKAQLLVPLSAHALFARPMVLGRDTVVDVEILPAAAGVVWCDGRRTFDLVPGMRVHTKVGAHELLLARTSEQPFVTRLVRKFGLPVDGWRGGA